VSASVNLPLHHKVQKFSSGTVSPGWSRKRGRETVVVVAGALSEAESGRRIVRPTTTEAEQLRVHEAGPSETKAEPIRQRRTHHHVDTSKQRCQPRRVSDRRHTGVAVLLRNFIATAVNHADKHDLVSEQLFPFYDPPAQIIKLFTYLYCTQ